MLLTKYVAKKFEFLNHLEKISQGKGLEKVITKMVSNEKESLTLILQECEKMIRMTHKNIPDNIGAEIFDIYDVEITVKPKSEINVEGVSLDKTSMKT